MYSLGNFVAVLDLVIDLKEGRKVETSNFCSNIPENIGGVWNGKERIKGCSKEEEILVYVNEWPAFNLFLKIAYVGSKRLYEKGR